MPAEIRQVFGIDASQALATLAQLDKGYESLAAKVRLLADASKGLNGTARQVSTLGAAVKTHVPASTEQVGRLTTSLQLLSRVVFTQAIVRGLSQLRNAITHTAQSAVEFQKQIALTTTIADGVKLDEIAAQVRRLSDQFNIPLLEAAEGVYNALSNP
jgi:hypothetical protein